MLIRDIEVNGDTSVHTAMHRVILARALARLGRDLEADTLLARAVPVLIERLPEVHPRIAQASVIRAELLLAQGNPGAADSAARRALRIMTSLAPANAAWHAEARVPLGLALVGTGQTAAGLAMLERALDDAHAVRGPVHATTRYAIEALRMAREISGKPEG
jgi:ATP/maltotriose-dependent transcriptional regulator MalT